MATAFSGAAVESRTLAAANSTLLPCRPLRAQPMAFTAAPRGMPVVHRIAEISAQRASIVAKAYATENANEEDMYERDERFQERVVQVRRVTKVVKGGKQLRFRAVVSKWMINWPFLRACSSSGDMCGFNCSFI